MFEGLGEEQVAGLANPGGLRSGRPGKRRGDSHPFDPPLGSAQQAPPLHRVSKYSVQNKIANQAD